MTGQLEARLNVDTIQATDLESSRFSAESGRGAAGVLDIKTKMGDDRWRFGTTNFFNSSTASQAINNDFGTTNFLNTSSAGTAVVINSGGGFTQFFDASTAGQAHLITTDGGFTEFFDTSTAGNAILAEAQRPLHERSMRVWLVRVWGPDGLKDTQREHEAIMSAIAASRPEAARKAMAHHLEGLRDRIVQGSRQFEELVPEL